MSIPQSTRSHFLMFPFLFLFLASSSASPTLAKSQWDRFVDEREQLVIERDWPHRYREIVNDHSHILHFGSEGRVFLDSLILKAAKIAESSGQYLLMVEVGVWFGDSTARWLSVSDRVRYVGIDPFTQTSKTAKIKRATDIAQTTRDLFGPAFNQGLAEYFVRHKTGEHEDTRFVFVNGFNPTDLIPILGSGHTLGLKTAFFYLDGGKNYDETVFRKYLNDTLQFLERDCPFATLAGDDWSHATSQILREKVCEHVQKKNLHLYVSQKRTWVVLQHHETFDGVLQVKEINCDHLEPL